MDPDEPLVFESAERHGVTEHDALHAWAFAIHAWDLGDGLVMYVGPARSGDLLEVGVVEWYGTIAIVHAMTARAKFLR